MDVTEILDKLRVDLSGCDLVAYADLSSGMVLCTSSAVKRPQEDIDALSIVASAVMKGPLVEGAASLLADGTPELAIAASASDLRVYLRAAPTSEEILMCVCAPDADVANAVSLGRDALAQIAAAG
jgi:hypothetical protein